MIFRSIRWRLQLWQGLLLIAILAAFGFTSYQVSEREQWRRVDEELDHQMMEVLFRPPMPPPGVRPDGGPPFPAPPPGGGAGPGRFRFSPERIREQVAQAIESHQNTDDTAYYFIAWNADGTLLAKSAAAPPDVRKPDAPPGFVMQQPPSPPAEFRPPRPGSAMRSNAHLRDGMREVYRFMPTGDVILTGRSAAPELASLRTFALTLFGAGGAVLLFGLAGGWWLASRAISPIKVMSDTAARIADGDLSHRIPVANTENELGRLAGVLNSTFARLETAFHNQARFTSDASHELRTPIAVILSKTQTALSREREPAEYRDALLTCQRAAERMRGLTESLLELARLDAGQQAMKTQPVDLARVAADCVELLRPLASDAEVTIHSKFETANCSADPEHISQVITNLVANALQFNHKGGEVVVSSGCENGSACLAVSDNGDGIAGEDLQYVFDRFFRADKSRSRVKGRSGLGLSICKSIVEAHGGTIAVHSHPGAGSTFVVKLPTLDSVPHPSPTP